MNDWTRFLLAFAVTLAAFGIAYDLAERVSCTEGHSNIVLLLLGCSILYSILYLLPFVLGLAVSLLISLGERGPEKKSMPQRFLRAVYISIIPAALWVVVVARTTNYLVGQRVSQEDVSSREFLLRVAGEMNKSMPMQIDRDTEIRNVGADSGQLIYNYVLVNHTLNEIDRGYFEQAMKPRLQTMACSSPDMSDLWKYGVAAVYSYQAKDGAFITKIAVTPKDCGY
jgi:hypothetical protein